MPINTVEEFNCRLCGYITRDKHKLEQIKKTGICPACQNGKEKIYTYKAKPREGIHKC